MQLRLRCILDKGVSATLNYLTYFYIILDSTRGPLYFREDLDKLEISMGFPSWISGIFPEILQTIGFIFFIGPLFYSIVGEAINKRRVDIKSLYRKAHTLLNIRWDISSGIYDAKTCIERLKRIDQPLHISSLVYPLLELQKRLQTLP